MEVPKFNPEFVALELLAPYFPVDGSTVNRWAKKLLESQREKRPGGHHGRWYVDYHAFRLLPNVMQWDKLPMDKEQLKKPNRSV